MNRSIASLVAMATAFVSLAPAASAAPQVPSAAVAEIAGAKSAEVDGVYLVFLDDSPTVAYEGELPGLTATRVFPGGKLDRNAPAVGDYIRHLEAAHDEVLRGAGVGSGAKLYDYVYASNGFAAELTAQEATAVARQGGVRAVVPDETRRLTSTTSTDSSPDFLELSHRQGPWATGYTGDDMVIGFIDSGIWPEHPSFADTGFGAAPPSFTGEGCALDDGDDEFDCNGKLLSAKAYGLGFHGGDGDGLAGDEYLSARDGLGHGTHTASIAAGNSKVEAAVLDANWGIVSGVAPRARVAVYKACWAPRSGPGSCAVSDLVAAIDDAVADGVDVINYPVGSASTAVGADAIAFLYAAAAGVSVVAAAGNDGLDPDGVASPAAAPWVTAVGAATQDRNFQGTVTLGDEAATTLPGATLSGGTDELELLDAAQMGNEECDPEVDFFVSIEAAVVLCHAGDVSAVKQSRAVSDQGGAAMVLANTEQHEPVDVDNLQVPSLHVSADDGADIAAYIAAAGSEAVATLSGGVPVEGQGSVMAEFSSAGPNGSSRDIVKPDVVAPGVDILAAQGGSGEPFAAMSGTSMASGHVAGAYALLRQAHPEWTPAVAKSALMTTGRHSVWKPDGTTPADVFDMGGGYIQPGGITHRRGSAFNPGLVYDAGLYEYAAYACGAELDVAWVPESCQFLAEAGFATDASDLNLPSIGVADLVGTRTVTRTVTSVADKIRVFESRVKAPPGFEVEVIPAVLTLEPGESAEFTVTFTRTRAGTGEWRTGSLTWAADGYRVVSPLAVRAAELEADDEVTGAGAAGSASFDVGFGYDGDFTAEANGLVAAVTEDGTVVDDPADHINTALATGVGARYHYVTVPEGTAHVRVSLSETSGDDDLDLYVFAPDGTFLGGSGSPTADEQVDFTPQEAASHVVVVHGFDTEDSDGAYTLSSWVVPDESDDSLTVTSAPREAATATTGTIEIEWSGLEPDTAYVGRVSHTGPSSEESENPLGLTLVTVDSGAAAPRAASTPAADDDDSLPSVLVPDRIKAGGPDSTAPRPFSDEDRLNSRRWAG